MTKSTVAKGRLEEGYIALLLNSEKQLLNWVEGKEAKSMCKALDDIYKDGVEEGRKEGIHILIESSRRFEVSEEEVITVLKEQYKLNETEAKEYVEMFK